MRRAEDVRRRVAYVFVTAIVTTSATLMVLILVPSELAFASGDATKAQCSQATESSSGFRAYLPECRAFELVTPPYKEGGVVLDEEGAISKSGTDVVTGAGGAFSGAGNYWLDIGRNIDAAAYKLSRGAGGWQAEALTPPAEEYSHSALLAVDADDFGTTLWSAAKSTEAYHEAIYLRTGTGRSEFHKLGPGTPEFEGREELAGHALTADEELKFVGASGNLAHSLFTIFATNPTQYNDVNDLWPGDTTKPLHYSLYEYDYHGLPDAEPTLVGIRNIGILDGIAHVNEGAEVISDCGTQLGSGVEGSSDNAVSNSGDVVFFTALQCTPEPVVDELYARVRGTTTLPISEPRLLGGMAASECASTEPCHNAEEKPAIFEGASEDGSSVVFLSEQPLVNGAPAEGMKLYEEHLNLAAPDGAQVEEVVDVSNLQASANPQVEGVVRLSENGKRLYFVAKGKLAGSDTVDGRTQEEAEPVEGADNLYVYEPDAPGSGSYRVRLVATLLTPSEEAFIGTKETEETAAIKLVAEAQFDQELSALFEKEARGEIDFEQLLELFEEAIELNEALIERMTGAKGPSGTLAEDRRMWQHADVRPAQSTPDGEFLVFLSSAKELTVGDRSLVPQLFEYDAGDEALTRVSIGEEGPTSGTVMTFDKAPRISTQDFTEVDRPTSADTGLAMSSDGSEVFFTSAASLASEAESEASSAYEYRFGAVYLISGGRDTTSYLNNPTVRLFGADESGADVFFLTTQQLVPQDGETQMALYDARISGGFPAPVIRSGCFGETCRGGPAATTPPAAPGSTGQSGNDNVVVSSPATGTGQGSSTSGRGGLARALAACRKERTRRRRACEARAKRKYGGKSGSGARRVTGQSGSNHRAREGHR